MSGFWGGNEKPKKQRENTNATNLMMKFSYIPGNIY